MRETEKRFLEAYSCALNGRTMVETADLSEILSIAEKQCVYPMLIDSIYNSLDKSKLAQKSISKAINLTISQAERTAEFLKLYRFLNKRNLKPVVMAGIICRNIYPEPEQCISSSERLLIPHEQYKEYQKAFLEYGLNENKEYMFSGKINVELYTAPFRFQAEDLNKYFIDVHEEIITEKVYGVLINTMEYTEHLFYLICMAYKHYSEDIRAISDILLYSIKHIDLIDWNKIIAQCLEIHAYDYIRVIYKIGDKYLFPQHFPEELKEIWNSEKADENAVLNDIFNVDNRHIIKEKKKEDYFLKRLYKKTHTSIIAPLFSYLYILISMIEYWVLNWYWRLKGHKPPSKDEQKLVRENVTFIAKSFERQKLARGLCSNINQMYPGVSIILADDSKKPLTVSLSNVRIIRMPFDSGLSAGLQTALNEVKTPFIVRMDDDELLTVKSEVHRELKYLMSHSELDLIGFGHTTAIRLKSAKHNFEENYKFPMNDALKPLKIPHLTKIDQNHIILGKVANIYIARTDKIREVGFDPNIKVIDHHEFFWRAAGVIVSAAALDTVVFHRHNPYERRYNTYRHNYSDDLEYIKTKHEKMKREAKRNENR